MHERTQVTENVIDIDDGFTILISALHKTKEDELEPVFKFLFANKLNTVIELCVGLRILPKEQKS